MQRVGYFNGEIGPLEDMTIPLCDRSVFFGDAVYDAVLVLGGKCYTLDEHIDRLYNSCRLAQIAFDMGRDALKAEIERLISAADGGTEMLYIEVTRGSAPRKHEFPKDARPNLIMSVTPLTLPDRGKRATLVSFEDRRFEYCNIKTVNLLPNVFAAQKTAECGATEALMHRGDRLTEAAHSSILALFSGVLFMPPLDRFILPGITRAVLTRLAKANGIPTEERIITVDELLSADEVLLCSTTKNLLRVFEVDGAPVGGKDGALALRLQDLLYADIEAQTGVLL